MGTAAVTTAGMKDIAMGTLGNVIVDVLVNRDDDSALSRARAIIIALTIAFPSYPADFPGYVGN
jgi:glycine/serine hydroxymethyltransferase